MALQMKRTYKAVDQDLAELAIEAHGGLERGNCFTLSVHGINGGVLGGAKSKAGVSDVMVTVDLRNEKVSHWPSVPAIEGLTSNLNLSRLRTRRVVLEELL
jgi:hypothetical protein